MRRGKNNKKEVTKIRLKKTKNSIANKRLNQKEPDLWKEIRFKLQPLSKAYRNFVETRRVVKQKEERKKQQEKEEKKFNVEQNKKRFNGKVKWFNGAKGYGFIESEGEEKDLFVHYSAVKNAGLKYLKEGEQLTFEVENTDKGFSAINLQKIS